VVVVVVVVAVTFQILVTDLADVQASNPNIPGELYLNNLLVPPSAGSTTVTYIAQEMGETGIYPIPTRSPQSFTALPGMFFIPTRSPLLTHHQYISASNHFSCCDLGTVCS
jgi:hypothetical protein